MAHRMTRDRGATLIELVVAMGIFAVFLAVFVAGIVSVSHASTQARVDAQTSSALGMVAQRVERSARYAESVNQPGTTGDRAYVEWRTSAVSHPSGVATCTQLRYNASTGILSMRSWVVAAAPSTGTWHVLATGLRGAATATSPFRTVVAATGVSNYQGLTLALEAGPSERVGSSVETTIYAKNSSVDAPSNAVAASGQSATPVCAGGGYRP